MGKSKDRDRKEKRHRRERKRKRGERDDSPPSPHRLLVEAAVGDRRACKKLLKAGTDVEYADADGTTALHEASRHGHLGVVQLLLKHEALPAARDSRGDTPAHLAARHRHLEVLSELLQSRHPPDVEARNLQGVTISQLAQAALSAPQPQRLGEDKVRAAQQAAQQAQRAQRAAESEGEDSWRQRLAQELSDAEEGSAWAESDYYGATEEFETAEEYAQRIWEEMQARRRAQRDAEMAAFRRRRRAEESRRTWARQQAEQASRRVLEEEQRKDADWRQAVSQGQAGAKRASYEARWQFFVTKHTEAAVGYGDVPWILPQQLEGAAGTEELQHVVLYGASTPEDKKRRLRSELVRWHPDKFVAKFGSRLVAADRERILERVNATSQILNALNADLQRQQQQG